MLPTEASRNPAWKDGSWGAKADPVRDCSAEEGPALTPWLETSHRAPQGQVGRMCSCLVSVECRAHLELSFNPFRWLEPWKPLVASEGILERFKSQHPPNCLPWHVWEQRLSHCRNHQAQGWFWSTLDLFGQNNKLSSCIKTWALIL